MAMEYQNFASLGVNLNRQKYGPLDISNVFTSEADLKYYLTKGTFTEGVSEYWYKSADEKIVPYPYEGQVLATVIDGVVSVYALALDAEGNFTTQEIGAKIETDDKTIKLVDGKLELVGLPEVTTGKTFVPSLVNGVLTWAEPDTSTAEGQQQAIDGLTARMTSVEETINGKPASAEGADDAVVGLVDKVAALEAVDNATQEELDSYKEEVTTAIGEALQAAKDYADAQDADTIYDDTALSNRVKAIEDDYLKTEDKYDDTALVGRVEAAEGKVATLEETVGNAEGGLVKDIADEIERAKAAEKELDDAIKAIDFVDPTELADAIKDFATVGYVDGEIDKIEEAIANLNHFKAEVVDDIAKVTEIGVLYLIKDESVAGVDKYNEYIVVDGQPLLIGDTTTDLSNYYNKTEIDGKVEALEGAIADEATARGELADRVADLEAIETVTQGELSTYKEEVTQAIGEAKQEAIDDADSKLANKLDTATFTEFQGTNTSAIATAKQEAIDAAAAAEEAKGYALDSEVKSTYATKSELASHEEEISNELLAYAKQDAVEASLAKKIETGSIAHSTDEVAEGVTVSGTNLSIVVDAFTKAETRKYVADTISQMTGGESAADVLLALNNYKSDNDERVGAIETKNSEQDTAIAAAQTQADKGVADAAAVASDLAALSVTVADNTRQIGVVDGRITTVNETLSGYISALQEKDTLIDGEIAGIKSVIEGHTSSITTLTGNVTELVNKDTELAALIQANADRFNSYSTTEEVGKAIEDAIKAIPAVDLSAYAKTEEVATTLEAYAKSADVYTKTEADEAFMTEGEVDARINALIVAADPEGGKTITDIQNLVKYVDENAGEIAALITATDANTAKLAGIETTVADAIASAIDAIVMPKASDEVTIAEDGTLGIGEVSTDKLVMGEAILIIDGGTAVT